jgi:hypothetical protein
MMNFKKTANIMEVTKMQEIIDFCSKKLKDDNLTTVVRFYFNILNQTFKNDCLETNDGWKLFASKITPMMQMLNKDLVIGSEIDVFFVSEFQNVPIMLFTVTCWNFFTNDNPCRSIPEARYDIRVDIVPDGQLPALKLLMRKYYERIEVALKTIWVDQVLSSIGTNASQEKVPENPPENNFITPMDEFDSPPEIMINTIDASSPVDDSIVPQLTTRKKIGITQNIISDLTKGKKESQVVTTTVKKTTAPVKSSKPGSDWDSVADDPAPPTASNAQKAKQPVKQPSSQPIKPAPQKKAQKPAQKQASKDEDDPFEGFGISQHVPDIDDDDDTPEIPRMSKEMTKG